MIHSLSPFAYSASFLFSATWKLIKTKFSHKNYVDISPDNLLERLEAGEPITIIDCRQSHVFSGIGHIQGAANYPVELFDEECLNIPLGQQLAVVCYFGYFCQIASKRLADLGHKNVLSMTGGMEEWIMTNKPIHK